MIAARPPISRCQKPPKENLPRAWMASVCYGWGEEFLGERRPKGARGGLLLRGRGRVSPPFSISHRIDH